MNYQFSNRISSIQASAIREILKQTANSNVISFAGGNPSTEAFPIEAIAKISQRILKEDPISVLQYGITEGNPMLIEETTKFFNRKENITKDNDQMLITSGSQQIMEFSVKCLCNEDDFILSENPSFIGALNAFKSQGVKVKGIGFKDGQLDLEALEEAYQLKPKFIYLIPNFQNPSGTTMNLETRKKVLELSKKYGVLILEDNPYGDLRFEGEDLPSIKSMDNDGIVIYAASLSKIIAPGMRIACCIAPKEIISKFVIAKQVSDIHSNLWSQSVMAEFIKNYDMEEHLTKLRSIYKRKCNLMISEMEKTFHPDVKYIKPTGGMFIWVTFPDKVDISLFVSEAIKRNVAVVPGSAFLVDNFDECHCIRLNYSTPSEQQIIEGIQILGKLTYDML